MAKWRLITLLPKTKKFFSEFSELIRASQHVSLEEARIASDKFFLTGAKLDELAKLEDIQIDGIHVKIFTPKGKGPFPMMVFFHGGGWVFGSVASSEPACRRMANKAKCIVASVEYSLAPENKYPIALEECYKATQWLIAHAEKFHADPKRVGVAGDSAGGNLAAAVALMARDKKSAQPAFQVLLYPVTEYNKDRTPYKECCDQTFLTYGSMMLYWKMYLNNPEEGEESYASPLKSKDLKHLPPAFIATSEYDPLMRDGKKYAEKLKAAGNRVVYFPVYNMLHGYLNLIFRIPQAKASFNATCGALKQFFKSL